MLAAWMRALRKAEEGVARTWGSSMSEYMRLLAGLASVSEGSIVECGVGGGASTIALLAGSCRRQATVHSYDLEPLCRDNVGVHIPPECLPDAALRWRFEASDASLAASRHADQSVGLFFLDASHALAETRSELAAWAPKMRKGGILCGHDYWLHLAWGDASGVQKAVDAFAASHQGSCELETFRAGAGFFILWPL
jgi:predicted O-methyltransferase YrrM